MHEREEESRKRPGFVGIVKGGRPRLGFGGGRGLSLQDGSFWGRRGDYIQGQ